MLTPLPLSDIRIDDPFFASRIDTARRVSIPYMWDALHDAIPGVEKSGCIANFEIAAGLREGTHTGWWFQDSDLFKWIEGAAYSLMTHPDASLEAKIDEAVDLAAKAQQSDGYLDTYYIIGGLDKRFTNLRDHHELYIAGHMFEAAVAYFEATGKRKLLDMACRFADCLCEHLGPEEGKLHGYPGHQEVELGLAKLYRVTGEKKYLDLAKFFLDARGHQPYFFDEEAAKRGEIPRKSDSRHPRIPYGYHQAHKPVREQTEALGHAVRQLYMLSGMADVGALCGDDTLVRAADTVLDNIARKQMYITGGVGSTHEGEAFSFDYDLPPERCYCETCASIALIMTAARLGRVRPNGRYGDIVERALYNGILSGISLDGTKYFYVNPLEVWPERCERRPDMAVDPERLGWFGCACCPPNVLRTLTGLGQYIYAAGEDGLYIDQYIASTATFTVRNTPVTVRLNANFPWDGAVRVAITAKQPVAFALRLRMPSWAKRATVRVCGEALAPEIRDGYLVIDRVFTSGDEIALEFDMQPRFLRASTNTPNYAGKAALMRGPLVYCLEEADNGAQLWNLCVDASSAQSVRRDALLGGVTAIVCDGEREQTQDESLYSEQPPERTRAQLTFVPYYAWGNRGRGEMTVWVRRMI